MDAAPPAAAAAGQAVVLHVQPAAVLVQALDHAAAVMS